MIGSTLSVILEMDNNLAVFSSAAVAVIYTFFGGMYSVALTDVIQLFFILFGLVCFAIALDQKHDKDELLLFFFQGFMHSICLDASGCKSRSAGQPKLAGPRRAIKFRNIY